MKLTELECRQAKPEARKRKRSDSKGLFLLITPTGYKSWRWKYRVAGKEKLLVLGSYPEVSLLKARQMRDEAAAKLRDGVAFGFGIPECAVHWVKQILGNGPSPGCALARKEADQAEVDAMLDQLSLAEQARFMAGDDQLAESWRNWARPSKEIARVHMSARIRAQMNNR